MGKVVESLYAKVGFISRPCNPHSDDYYFSGLDCDDYIDYDTSFPVVIIMDYLTLLKAAPAIETFSRQTTCLVIMPLFFGTNRGFETLLLVLYDTNWVSLGTRGLNIRCKNGDDSHVT